MQPPPIEQQVTFLYTQDLAATTAFYEQTLGLPLVLDQGPCRIYRVAGEAFLGFCTSPAAAAPPPSVKTVIFTLVTPDVAGWYHYLRDRGVAFEQPPKHNDTYNIDHCFLRDPNGYLLEIQRFCDPRWPVPRVEA